MKNNILSLIAVGTLIGSLFITSCNKSKDALTPETYKLVGRLDAARTTLATAALTKAEFTVTFNTPNSFEDAQSVINGNLTLSGYSGITGKDTLSFFGTQASGPNISYITVANAAVNTTNTTNFYTYFNGPAASFTFNNFPYTADVTAALREGRGFFRLGQAPKYVYILMDNVTKL